VDGFARIALFAEGYNTQITDIDEKMKYFIGMSYVKNEMLEKPYIESIKQLIESAKRYHLDN
jgi:hypothetical protein